MTPGAPVAFPIADRVPLRDSDIADALQKRMWSEVGPLDVRVEQGVATVSGSVVALAVKRRAIGLPKVFKGVRAVIDDVDVGTPLRGDDAIRQDTLAALARDPGTRSARVQVAVQRGTVTLTGTVDSVAQKRLVADVSASETGVRAVENEALVEAYQAPPDEEILSAARHRIAGDAWLEGARVGARVSGGRVSLDGVVGSVAEKERAAADAAVPGVLAVDASALRVEGWTKEEMLRAGPPQVSDLEIESALQRVFRADPALGGQPVQVLSSAGIVRLSGNVGDLGTMNAAEEDARNTVGVRDVVSILRVVPPGAPSDREVARNVETALGCEWLVPEARALRVAVAKGFVTLEGTVSTATARLMVERDAATVPGVTGIDDRVVAAGETPRGLEQRVRAALARDPTVISRFEVAVSLDYTATLSGIAATPGENAAAREDARRAGARRVIDQIHIARPASAHE